MVVGAAATMRARLYRQAGWPRIRRAAGKAGGGERSGRFHRRATGAGQTSSMADPKEPSARTEAQPDLVERARRGDQAAFGQLVRLHQRRIYACAVQMLGDRGEAEDAVQETFVRAWKAIDRFDGRAELSTWLYRICINVSLNALRRRKRVDAADISDPRLPEPAADPTQGQTDPRHAAQALELYGRLAKALDDLSPSLRATVVLVLLEGMPQKEASDVLGCSEGTIAWRVHEARRRLRMVLGDYLDEPTEGETAKSGDVKATGRRA